MRNLTFILCLFLGAFYAGEPVHAYIAKTHKSGASGNHKQRSKTSHLKKTYRPADAWARISMGIRLPKPASVALPAAPEPLPSAQVATVVTGTGKEDPAAPTEVSASASGNNAAPATTEGQAGITPNPKRVKVLLSRMRQAAAGTADAQATGVPAAQNSSTTLQPATKVTVLRSGVKVILPNTKTIQTSEASDGAALRPVPTEAAKQQTEKAFSTATESELPVDTETLQRQHEQQLQRYAELKHRYESYQRYATQLAWYQRNKGFIQQSVERARPYLYLIVEELDKRRLPLDLALLPILESGYQPRAESPMAASGIWQFIPSTGKLYGLKQNDWYDGRLDIAASTQAAAIFLEHLGRHFNGDWLLALASYNCGEGRVEQAIKANAEAGLPTDFWSLALPEETMAYVPRMLALSEMFSKPKAYNLKLKPVPNQPYLFKVKFAHTLRVEDVSMLANLSTDTFLYLNPGFTDAWMGTEGPYELLLPRQNVEAFNHRLEAFLHPAEPRLPVLDLVQNIPGLIPATFQDLLLGSDKQLALFADNKKAIFTNSLPAVPADKLIKLSNRQLENTASEAGKAKKKAAQEKTQQRDIFHVHGFAAGETIESIAAYYNVDASVIRDVNKLHKRKFPQPGQELIIPLEQASPFNLMPAGTANASKSIFREELESQFFSVKRG